jgi:hypothetical protein
MFVLDPSTNKYSQIIQPDFPRTAIFLTSRVSFIHILNFLLVYKENSLLTRDSVVCRAGGIVIRCAAMQV